MKIKLHPLRVFEKRHLVLFCAISVSLLLISYFIPMIVKVLLIALCAVFAVYFALSKRQFNFLDKESKYHTVMLTVMIGAILLSSFISYDIAGMKAEEYTGEHKRITAYALPNSENTVRITEIDGASVSFNAVFYGSELLEKYEELNQTTIRLGIVASPYDALVNDGKPINPDGTTEDVTSGAVINYELSRDYKYVNLILKSSDWTKYMYNKVVLCAYIIENDTVGYICEKTEITDAATYIIYADLINN